MLGHLVPAEEPVRPGHAGCAGCGARLAMRLVLKALGPGTVVAMPAFPWTVLPGSPPRSALEVPVVATEPDDAAAAASAIRSELDARGDSETTVLAWAGDDGTLEIGLAALSRAAERNEDILFVCHDGEACRNADFQLPAGAGSGAKAPVAAAKALPRRDLVAILAAHRVPYAATASVAHPVDLIEKVRRAKRIRGTRFLHVLSPCPPGWRVREREVVALARMAVDARVFPLLEVENGTRWRLTAAHRGDPVEPWLVRQGRFGELTPEEIRHIQSEVDARWQSLLRRVEHGT